MPVSVRSVYNTSFPIPSSVPGAFRTYPHSYNHAHRLRLEKHCSWVYVYLKGPLEAPAGISNDFWVQVAVSRFNYEIAARRFRGGNGSYVMKTFQKRYSSKFMMQSDDSRCCINTGPTGYRVYSTGNTEHKYEYNT